MTTYTSSYHANNCQQFYYKVMKENELVRLVESIDYERLMKLDKNECNDMNDKSIYYRMCKKRTKGVKKRIIGKNENKW